MHVDPRPTAGRRRRYGRIAVFLMLITVTLVAIWVPVRRTSGAEGPGALAQVPVLLYHNLRQDSSGENGATIPLAEFDAQMRWLKEHGYHAITVTQLAGWLEAAGLPGAAHLR